MEKQIQDILNSANILKNNMEVNLAKAFEQIENIKDEKTKEFLKNSVNLAKNGTLNITTFLEQTKQYTENANGNNSK